MIRSLSLLALFTFLGSACGEVTLEGPDKVPLHKLVILQVKGAAPDSSFIWDVDGAGADWDEAPGKLTLTGPAGDYVVRLKVVNWGAKRVEPALRKVVTIGSAPQPPGPKPPGPTPTPTPDPPSPNPAPIPEPGFRVLIIRDTTDTLTPEQTNAMTAKVVRDYLNTKCIKVDGVPEWRNWSTTDNPAFESEIWQKAMKRPRGEGTWLIISNGKTGYEGNFPADTPSFLQLLKTFGDQ